MNIIQTTLTAINARIAIIVSRFNQFINNNLLIGALDVFKRIGQIKDENITVIWVPGAYELPLTAKVVANTDQYDAIVALGTVIRGNTFHFECIACSVSNSLSHVAQSLMIPIGFGILTTENIEQAIERAGTKIGNKGAEAALATLEMINVIKAIQA